MKITMEASEAVAEVVANCEPDVVACYPITPSTHIAEHLAQLHADGRIKSYIAVEQEFSSMSACIGAAAAGGRTFTATSSQGLALMHEPVYCAAGMRLPITMVVGNRALSAPLNIWNDWQDSIAERDSGWIQLYSESSQEAIDNTVQAFKVSEQVMLPAMVCMDGFILTHVVEPVEIPEVEDVRKYLPKLKMDVKLDTENPMTMGAYAMPADYQNFREDVHKDLLKAKENIKKEAAKFEKQFDRGYGDGLIQGYNMDDSDYIFISMGSTIGTARDAVEESDSKYGILKIRSYRPFPYEEISKALEGKKGAVVFEKAYSMGALPPVYSDVANAMKDSDVAMSSFVGGLGGKDVRKRDINSLMKKISDGKEHQGWL
ncbi:MAG: pyruvate ferredoxin oxidoreductase [archaeon]